MSRVGCVLTVLSVVTLLCPGWVNAADCLGCFVGSVGDCKNPDNTVCFRSTSGACPMGTYPCDDDGTLDSYGGVYPEEQIILIPPRNQPASCATKGAIGYYPSPQTAWRPDGMYFYPEAMPGSKMTHAVYAYAAVNPTTYAVQHMEPEEEPENMRRFVSHIRASGCAKAIIGVGGQNWNTHGRTISSWIFLSREEVLARAFAKSLVSFARTNGFDGFDLNWEFHGHPASSDAAGATNSTHLTTLLSYIREEVQSDAQRRGVTALSFSLTLSPQLYIMTAAYNLEGFSQYVDFVNVMTVNLHASWESETNPHSALWDSAPDEMGFRSGSIAQSVNFMIEEGMAPGKIAPVMAGFARTWSIDPRMLGSKHAWELGPGLDAFGEGLPGPVTGRPGFFAYQEIQMLCSSNITDIYTICDPDIFGNTTDYGDALMFLDERTTSMWLLAGDVWMSFDTPMSITAKWGWVWENNLFGAGLWSVDQDHWQRGFPLMSAMINGARVRPTPSNTPAPSRTPTRTNTRTSSPSLTPTPGSALNIVVDFFVEVPSGSDSDVNSAEVEFFVQRFVALLPDYVQQHDVTFLELEVLFTASPSGSPTPSTSVSPWRLEPSPEASAGADSAGRRLLESIEVDLTTREGRMRARGLATAKLLNQLPARRPRGLQLVATDDDDVAPDQLKLKVAIFVTDINTATMLRSILHRDSFRRDMEPILTTVLGGQASVYNVESGQSQTRPSQSSTVSPTPSASYRPSVKPSEPFFSETVLVYGGVGLVVAIGAFISIAAYRISMYKRKEKEQEAKNLRKARRANQTPRVLKNMRMVQIIPSPSGATIPTTRSISDGEDSAGANPTPKSVPVPAGYSMFQYDQLIAQAQAEQNEAAAAVSAAASMRTDVSADGEPLLQGSVVKATDDGTVASGSGETATTMTTRDVSVRAGSSAPSSVANGTGSPVPSVHSRPASRQSAGRGAGAGAGSSSSAASAVSAASSRGGASRTSAKSSSSSSSSNRSRRSDAEADTATLLSESGASRKSGGSQLVDNATAATGSPAPSESAKTSSHVLGSDTEEEEAADYDPVAAAFMNEGDNAV